jgi:hypothetical protein
MGVSFYEFFKELAREGALSAVDDFNRMLAKNSIGLDGESRFFGASEQILLMGGALKQLLGDIPAYIEGVARGGEIAATLIGYGDNTWNHEVFNKELYDAYVRNTYFEKNLRDVGYEYGISMEERFQYRATSFMEEFKDKYLEYQQASLGTLTASADNSVSWAALERVKDAKRALDEIKERIGDVFKKADGKFDRLSLVLVFEHGQLTYDQEKGESAYQADVVIINSKGFHTYEKAASTYPNPVDPISGKPAREAYGQLAEGIYRFSVVEKYYTTAGEHPALMIESGKTLRSDWPNVNHGGRREIDKVFMHMGDVLRRELPNLVDINWRGSKGCITIDPDRFFEIMRNFSLDQIGLIGIFR